MTATIVGPGGVVDQGEAGTEAWPVSIAGEINVDVDVSALATQATLATAVTHLADLASDDDGIARDTSALAIRDRLPSSLDNGSLAVIDQDPGDRSQFESYLPPTSDTYQIRYIGSATQGTASSAATWIVKRLTWERLADGADHITDLQTIVGVWDDRETLTWS